MYQSAIEAYDAAAEYLNVERGRVLPEKVRKKEAEEVPVASDAHTKMVAAALVIRGCRSLTRCSIGRACSLR